MVPWVVANKLFTSRAIYPSNQPAPVALLASCCFALRYFSFALHVPQKLPPNTAEIVGSNEIGSSPVDPPLHIDGAAAKSHDWFAGALVAPTRREAPPSVIVALLPPARLIARARPADPAPALHLASEECRHERAIGFGADLAFAARSIDNLRRPDLCLCRAGLSPGRFAAWLEKGARDLERCRPSISRAKVPPANLSLSFADSTVRADSSSSTGGPLLPPLERGCRCVSYTPAQAHLCPKLDAGVAAAHSPSVPRSSGWRSRRSTAELAHAGPWLDLARIWRGLVRKLPATTFVSGGFSLEIEALGSR
nr:uncharacterized protein LOC117834049 [Setaria viridis]